MQNFGLVRIRPGLAELQPVPIPRLPEDYLLVRTVTIALNPTDWTTLDAVGNPGTIVGCDYAGIVEDVGKAVTKNFRKGDRVAGFGHGGNDAMPENGAFCRLIAVKADIQFHIPDGVSFEAACTIGCGISTVGYGLYKILNLPLPLLPLPNGGETILIYGGSTATGTLAIQFAKLSGWKVVTTCSPKHFGLMKELGADLVYDYHTYKVGEQINAATNGTLKTVFDTVAIETSAKICADAFGSYGGVYCNLLGIDCPQPNVQSVFFLGYDISGEFYVFEGKPYEARPEAFAFASKFATVAERLWANGKWKPHPQRVGDGGFLGAIGGMQEMREGKYSGEKLVYRVDDTNWP